MERNAKLVFLTTCVQVESLKLARVEKNRIRKVALRLACLARLAARVRMEFVILALLASSRPLKVRAHAANARNQALTPSKELPNVMAVSLATSAATRHQGNHVLMELTLWVNPLLAQDAKSVISVLLKMLNPSFVLRELLQTNQTRLLALNAH